MKSLLSIVGDSEGTEEILKGWSFYLRRQQSLMQGIFDHVYTTMMVVLFFFSIAVLEHWEDKLNKLMSDLYYVQEWLTTCFFLPQ